MRCAVYALGKVCMCQNVSLPKFVTKVSGRLAFTVYSCITPKPH